MRIYANTTEIIRKLNADKLLVGNNLEWACEAVNGVDHINLDNYVEADEIKYLIEYIDAKIIIEEYDANFGKVKAYQDLKERLSNILQGVR